MQGIEGVRFKRLIMDESASDRSPHPPEDASKKRLIFCTGKVRPRASSCGGRLLHCLGDTAVRHYNRLPENSCLSCPAICIIGGPVPVG